LATLRKVERLQKAIDEKLKGGRLDTSRAVDRPTET